MTKVGFIIYVTYIFYYKLVFLCPLQKVKENGKVKIEIVGSASRIPSTKFKSNTELAKLRIKKGKKIIYDYLDSKNISRDSFQIIKEKAIVSGPKYNYKAKFDPENEDDRKIVQKRINMMMDSPQMKKWLSQNIQFGKDEHFTNEVLMYLIDCATDLYEEKDFIKKINPNSNKWILNLDIRVSKLLKKN